MDPVITGYIQESVLGSLLFNIYLNDLYFLVNYRKVYNFADATTFLPVIKTSMFQIYVKSY